MELKGKVYKNSSLTITAAEYCAITKGQEAIIQMNTMTMLRWMFGVAKI